MSNDFIRNKVTLRDTSFTGPSLVDFNGRVYIAWAGVGNRQINVMSSADGINFENKVTLRETSGATPALTVFNNRLYLAWTGTDAAGHLNLMSSANGVTFENKVTLEERSFTGPSVTTHFGRLYLAWAGVENRQLNVMSSAGGATFENKITLSDTTIATLCITGVIAPLVQMLYLLWTGTDDEHHLNYRIAFFGEPFRGTTTLNETSFAGPVLAEPLEHRGQLLWISWAGVGNRQLNFLNTQTGSKTTIGDTSIAGPGLTPTHVAWTGTDPENHLNVASYG